jgi:hypothetical protein
MANAAYPLWLKSLLDVWLNIASANPAGSLRVAIVTSAYTYSSAHEFYSSVTGEVGTANLASITTTGGVLDADNTTVGSLTGAVNYALVLHWWTGNAATSRLMLYFDTGINFGTTPTGDQTVIWPEVSGVKIFPLGGLAA